MSASSDAAVAAAKSDLRREAARVRARLHGAGGADAATAVARLATGPLAKFPAGPVAAYFAFRTELDSGPLMRALDAAGRDLCLPVVGAPGEALRFRHWRPGEATRRDVYDVPIPLDGAPDMVPAVLFVPLLAFDDTGYRLGYGAGYYDRTLAALRAAGEVVAVGLGFAGQEVASVPHNAYDQPMDYILCETGWRRMPAARGGD